MLSRARGPTTAVVSALREFTVKHNLPLSPPQYMVPSESLSLPAPSCQVQPSLAPTPTPALPTLEDLSVPHPH